MSVAELPEGTVRAGGLSAEALLGAGLAELGLGGRSELREGLLRYAAEIEAWNPSLGLVNASGGELVVRHLLDSLAGAPVFAELERDSTVLDVGSGAGFPGLPLALAYPRLGFVLLDRSSKRCTFLEHCLALLGLPNVRVWHGEVRTFLGDVQAATFRALAPLTPAFLRSSGILARAPLVVAYKGRAERAREEMQAVEGLYGSARIVRLRVPFLEGERSLVLLRR